MTRRVRNHLPTLVVALFAGAAGVAGSYAIAGFTPGFVAAPIAGFAARRLPDVVVRYAITVLGSFGQQLNLLSAVALAGGLFTVTSLLALLAGRRRLDGSPTGSAALAFVLTALVAAAVTGVVLPSLAAGVAAGVVVAVALLASAPPVGTEEGRREVLGSLASALAVGVGGYLLGSSRRTPASVDGTGNPSGTDAERALLTEASEKSLGVEGLGPLVSTDFYEVDINAVDPTPSADDWTLTITGAVDEEVTLTYDDLTGMASERRFTTLRCVGESLNGQKMDNALWTGVPVMDVVETAGLELDECCVMLRAADDYYEEFPIEALRDGFLAYRMNGRPLPRGHGHPVRALVPGHWGEINVKWLTEVEVLEEAADGYWEKRGWHGTGPVETVAKLHAVNHRGDGTVQVAGHAYAGTRGIQQVEVSTDGGTTWSEATLSAPLPGDDVWRQWAFVYDSPGEPHEVVVRATDGTGTLQPAEETGPFPSGPSGWVSRTVER